MAAERFGGPYSPDPRPEPGAGQADGGDGAPPLPRFRNRRATRVNILARLTFFAPLPLLLAGLGEIGQGDAMGMLGELGGFALLILAAWLLSEGLKAEDAYDARKVARPPAFPRKIVAGVVAGIGVALACSLGAGLPIPAGIVFGAVATAAHLLGFGLDPMRKKGLEGVDEFQSDRVARAIEGAEALVAGLLDASQRIGDRGLEARVERLAAQAREVFRVVEDDPRDLPRARKFLTVYLMGARDATAKFADLYSRNRDTGARTEYEALLGDLETSFSQHRKELLLDDRSDLDVEIEVLRERLNREGLKA